MDFFKILRTGIYSLVFAAITFLLSCEDEPVSPDMQVRIPESNRPYEKLSEYGLFQYPFNLLQPVQGVFGFKLNTPLFSDYALKERFIYLPEKGKMQYIENEALDFPVGTVLIKNFYYESEGQKNIIETRLLIRYTDGWKGFPYEWNKAQNEAYLVIGGADKTLPKPDNTSGNFIYKIPNQNQCKGCHAVNNSMVPIGPKAGNLNLEIEINGQSKNQLDYWIAENLLTGIASSADADKYAKWDDSASGSLTDRARVYLDVNCGHCHRPEGAANNTGLNLYLNETDKTALGFCKFPIAAGKGSGGRMYDIVPGKPDQSIVTYRMESVEPESKMPEIGRQLVHREGVKLIRSWIESLEDDTCN